MQKEVVVMSGLMHKELKQNWILIILTAVTALFTIFSPVIFSICIQGNSRHMAYENIRKNGDCIRVALCLIGYAVTGILQWITLKDNNPKNWAYFTASTPKGIKACVSAKYKMIVFMVIFQYLCCCFFNISFTSDANQVLKENMPELSYLFFIMLGVQLLLRAVEIPFTIKYGTKTGILIKAGMLLVIIIVINVLVAFNPGEIVIKVISLIVNEKEISNIMKPFIYFIGMILTTVFVLSYQISCKLNMKRVQQCDQ